MSARTISTVVLLAVAGSIASAASAAVANRAQDGRRTGIAFDRRLPAMDGAQLAMKVVDVHVAPGAASPPHRHNCVVAVYVVQGAMRMSVRGGADSVYRRGEVFLELPTDVHQTSANASASDSAHFTATFVCDHQGPLSIPAPGAPGAGGGRSLTR